MATVKPSHLFKFVNANKGLDILKHQHIRWNAPHGFQDPFEQTYLSVPKLTKESFTEKVTKEIVTMVFALNDPTGQQTTIKNAVRRWREEDRFHSEEEATDALTNLVAPLIDKHFTDIQHMIKLWRLYTANARILCMSENYKDLNLWENRGDNHQGMVIRFRVGNDGIFQHPHKVNYTKNRISFLNIREEIQLLIEPHATKRNSHFLTYLLNKSKTLANQKEWRFVTNANHPLPPGQYDHSAPYDMKTFNTKDINAVYFGAAMRQEKKIAIIDIIEQNNPNIKVFEGQVSHQDYDINFIQTSFKEIKSQLTI